MKTAYELAMGRLSKDSPSVKLTPDQKQALADLDSVFKAKIAEREIALKDEWTKAAEAGNQEAMEKAEQHLAEERRKLRADLEDKKEKIRQAKS
jgi:hypothetical protein